ncbi:tetratricopeptide repeat protein [Verrucomicrobiaceae bacterium N1E253]|uniref:Tetratricopeptide repeat protein n=1 Tax=Oceaniferula marina TaxID=2748318 RepID=A0A851GDH5_9BACT|nr:tetratricopeptide repeat protein [Oceaniferula marina]NWK55603.1 tetratricopeptide repeat protein [Oceaniferula marina]
MNSHVPLKKQQSNILYIALVAIFLLGVTNLFCIAEEAKVKSPDLTSQPHPVAPTGWKDVSNPWHLQYYWSSTSISKSKINLSVKLSQRAFSPTAYNFEKEQFAKAGKEFIAELDKKAAEKNGFFVGNSTAGPWKMKTYVVRNTNLNYRRSYPNPMVVAVFYQENKKAWAAATLRIKCSDFPANAPPEWFAAHAIQGEAGQLASWSSNPKTWTPAAAPRWEAFKSKAQKEGAEKLQRFEADLKKVSAAYEQGLTLYLEVLHLFLKSQGADVPLNASYFRNPNPILFMKWYHWPKEVQPPVMPSSPQAKTPDAPSEKTPVSKEPLFKDPESKKTAAKEPLFKEPEDKESAPKEPAVKQPPFEQLITQASDALDQENYDLALKASQQAVKAKPQDLKARWYMGLAFIGQKKYKEAYAVLDAVAKDHPDNTKLRAFADKIGKKIEP